MMYFQENPHLTKCGFIMIIGCIMTGGYANESLYRSAISVAYHSPNQKLSTAFLERRERPKQLGAHDNFFSYRGRYDRDIY